MEACPHCLAGSATTEISGLRFHTFADRWISCTVIPEQQKILRPVRGNFASVAQSAYQAICVGSTRLRRRMYGLGNP